jgi:hypothetical protein
MTDEDIEETKILFHRIKLLLVRFQLVSDFSNIVVAHAHYANQHHGCCVEFDVRRLFVPDGVGFLLPVVYKDKLFDVTKYFSAIAAGGGNNWAAIIAACHKDKDWAYEREWRIVLPFVRPEGENNLSIPIKSISIGLRTERKVQERLFEIARRLRVPLYRAVQSLTEAKVFFEPVTELA